MPTRKNIGTPRKSLESTTPKHLGAKFVPRVPTKALNDKTMAALEGNRWIQDELAKQGFRIVPLSDITAVEAVSNRFDLFAGDIKQSFEILAGQVLPLLAEMRDVVKEHGEAINHATRRITVLETDRDKATNEITGIHKRLIVVEEILTARPQKARRK